MKISGQLLKKIIKEEVKKNLANSIVSEEETATPKAAASAAKTTGIGVGKAQAKAADSKSDVERALEVMLNDKKLAPLLGKIDTSQEKAQIISLIVNQFPDKSDVKKVFTMALSILSKQQ